MSSGPPPPPPPPPPGAPRGAGAAGGRGGAPHPASLFGSRPPASRGAPAPFGSAKMDPAARRANTLSVYSQYTNPMASTKPVAAAAPPPPSSSSSTPAPPPPPPPPPLLQRGGPAVAAPSPSSQPVRTPLPRMEALTAPDSSDALPPPPPPPSRAAAGPTPMGRAAGGASRYAVPDFTATTAAAAPADRGGEFPASAGRHPDVVGVTVIPGSPFSPTAPPTASRSTLEAEAMAPAGAEGEKAATPLPATAAAPPPLTTRVSGAGLRGAASSRASSNGGGSRASSRHSQREPKPALLDSSRQHQPQESPPTSAAAAAAATPQKDAASTMFMFAQDVGGRPQNEGAASATAPLPSSRPGSRSGSLHAHNAAAAAIASGGRRPSSSAATNAPSGAAGAALHRDVPSFLKPAGGGVAGLPQRGRLASNSAAGLATTPTATGAATAGSAASTSRGRELLEAALQSRGNRLAHLRGGAAAAASSAAKDSSAAPAAAAAAAGGGAQPGKEMVTVRELPKALQQSQPSETTPCQDGEETTDPASAPAGAGGAAPGGTSTGDFSATSRSCGGGDSSNYSSPVLRVPPLMHGQASAAPSASAQAMTSSAPLDLDRQQKGTKSANSILPSSMGNRAPSALIAGEVDATSAEVLDVAQRHTPRSGALEPLPTPTGETSQHNVSGSMQPSSAAHGPPLPPAAEQQGSTNTAPHHYSSSHGGAGGNPFAEAGGDSFLECGMDDGSEPAFGAAGSPLDVPPPPPPTRHPQQYQQQLPVQPPPLPRHAQYPGASPTGSPPPTARHSDRAGAPLSSATPPFSAAAAAAPQLPVPPPLPHAQQQHQSQLRPPMMPPPLPTNTHAQASSTANNNNNNGFTTPRGHGAAGAASDPITQPRPSLNRADVSHAAAPSSAARGPYVASPYVRDADNSRAMDDESPMPLRPPSFSSVPQPEEDEANEAAGHASMEVPPMEDDGEEGPFGGSAFREEQPPCDEAANDAPATSATAVDKENAPSHAGADDAFQWAEDDAYSSNAASPPLGTRAAWEGGGHGGDVEEGARDSGTLDEHQRARQPTQLPSDFAALPASMSSSDPHPTQAAMTTATTAAATTPTAAVTSPPPPSHAAPGTQNRGAANPFSAWQPPVSHRDSSDALRRQHQEQLQARVLAAQQSGAGSGGSAPPPPPPTASATATRGSPSAEDATRDLHGFVSPRGETPFSGSQYGSTSNLAHATSQAEPQPEGAHPRTGLEAHSSPLDLRAVDSLAHPSVAAASASNPFLDADDDGAGGAGGSRNAAAASVDVGGLLGAKTHHRATSSLSSLPLQQPSPQPLSGTSSVNGGPALSVGDDDGSGLHNNPSTFLSASGASANGGSAATSRTPGGTTLVNPFSKAARTAAAAAAAATTAAAAANGTLEAAGGQSAGASLSNSFAGRRKTVRRVAAPCFAIFVGGATTGVPLTEMGRSVTCIAACFNHPRAASPTHSSSMHGGGGSSGSGGATGNAGRVRSPASQPMGGGTAASLTGAHRTQSNAASSRLSHTGVSIDAANLSSAAAHANTTSPSSSSSSCLSFCSVAEALTTKGSVVDRKGIRGTESGRRYVQALREAVLPCALNTNGPSWSALAEAVAALDGCVPAPLMGVLSVILKDALAAETGEGFAWKENGGRRLGEMLLQAAQAEARRYATTATSAQGSNAILAAALHASPLNLSPDTATVLEGKEKAAVVTKLEDLLCLGKRVEAVEAALEARLYAHALLISMMCPTKEAYLKSVQAVMQQELCVHSPLAHAYSMFNELPLPPLLPPPPPSAAPAARLEGSEDSFGNAEAATAAAALEERRLRDLMLRDQASLKGTWRRHAAVLLANFTRHSGEGLLALAARLQQLRLVMESHTCLLLLHLTPLGMAAPVRAGAEPLPPASAMSPEEMEDVLPRPDQRQAMDEIRRRLGVVGGIYHPTQGCRAGFLTPVTTLLTQLLQVAHDLLNRRAPPLAVPGAAEGGGALPVAFHGLPGCAPRTDVAYRMMQVAWLREIGLVRESRQALNALLHRMPPPAAFSLQAPPRTLNELVYLFGAVPPPAQAGGVPLPSPLSDPAMEPADESTPGNMSTTQQPSTATSTALAPRSADDEALERSERAKGSGSSSSAPRGVSDSLPLSPDDHHGGLEGNAPPPPQQQQQQQMPPPPPGRPGGALPPASALAKSRLPGMTPAQRASALQPPTRQPAMPPPPPSSQLPPPPPQQQQQPPMPPAEGGRPVAAQPQPPDAQADAGVQPPPPPPKPAAKPAAKPTSRRSRSMDALRNLFFRRGKSEAEGGEKQPPAEEAKPMHLDTEKPPEFDPVTGRWLFPETEEEKKLRELVKQGPPKMAPRAPSQPTPTPPPAPGAGGPAAAMAAQEPPASRLPSAAPESEAVQASSPPPTAAMRRTPGPPGAHPAPQHGVAAPVFVPGRGAPPPMMAGRGGGGGVRRPGGRQQYVDMFNSAT